MIKGTKNQLANTSNVYQGTIKKVLTVCKEQCKETLKQ